MPHTHFLPFDATDPASWTPFKKYLQADLFTFSYFVSEIQTQKEQVRRFFDHLFKKAKKGAVVLFIDNNAPEFFGWFDEITAAHRFDTLDSDELHIKMPLNEEKSELGEYLNKFGSPKLGGNIAYRILRKPRREPL